MPKVQNCISRGLTRNHSLHGTKNFRGRQTCFTFYMKCLALILDGLGIRNEVHWLSAWHSGKMSTIETGGEIGYLKVLYRRVKNCL